MSIITKMRIDQLKKMSELLMTCSDTSLLSSWWSVAIPNNASEEDFQEIAESDILYNECIAVFKRIVNNQNFYI